MDLAFPCPQVKKTIKFCKDLGLFLLRPKRQLLHQKLVEETPIWPSEDHKSGYLNVNLCWAIELWFVSCQIPTKLGDLVARRMFWQYSVILRFIHGPWPYMNDSWVIQTNLSQSGHFNSLIFENKIILLAINKVKLQSKMKAINIIILFITELFVHLQIKYKNSKMIWTAFNPSRSLRPTITWRLYTITSYSDHEHIVRTAAHHCAVCKSE
jgi:hypothetical protein